MLVTDEERDILKLSHVSIVPPKVTVVNLAQRLKEFAATEVKLAGSEISVKDLQLLNARLPIAVSLVPKEILVSTRQPENAFSPIVSTLSAVTVVSFVQLINALAPTMTTFFKSISVSATQLEKVLTPISFNPLPKVMFVSSAQ